MIVLDLQLKEGTGFGVMQRLGETRPMIIVFTNYMLPEYQRLARALGVEYFLNKSATTSASRSSSRRSARARPHYPGGDASPFTANVPKVGTPKREGPRSFDAGPGVRTSANCSCVRGGVSTT